MGELKALEALFPGPKPLILRALFGEPARWWSLADLGAKAGMRPGTLRFHLVQLREGGIVRENQDRGRAYFQPDPGCRIYAELQSIVSKLTSTGDCGRTILVAEDQPATAQITRILLESWGYQVLEAHGSAEAIALFENSRGEIHLLLTDVIMPGMSGIELANELRRQSPQLRVVFMSGYPDDQARQPDTAFLPKPFNPSRLARMVRKELARCPQARRRMNMT